MGRRPTDIHVSGTSVFTGRRVEIGISNGRILSVEEDAGETDGVYVSPGFFDMQVNGFRGSDYSLDALSVDDVMTIHEHLVRAGTTQHIPTIVTSPQERFLKNLSVLAQAIDTNPTIATAIPGIHIEGPYLSEKDGPRGAHDTAYIRDPDYNEFTEWQAASGNRIVMVTIAPERNGSLPFIERVSSEGVVVAIGHTAADPETIHRAIAAGARVSTHLGNGSSAELPRLHNPVWEQLADDQLYAGIIADGFHLPESVLRVFHRAKGLARLILVSDVALLGGKNPGIYKWGNLDVQVYPDGHIGLPGTPFLAGAAHLLDWDIPHFQRVTGLDLAAVIRLCTENPAQLLGLQSQITTRLAVDQPAHLVEFSYTGGENRLEILRTIAGGKVVYQRKP